MHLNARDLSHLREAITHTAHSSTPLPLTAEEWLDNLCGIGRAVPELSPVIDAAAYALETGRCGTARIKTPLNDCVLVIQWHTNAPDRPKRIEVCYLS